MFLTLKIITGAHEKNWAKKFILTTTVTSESNFYIFQVITLTTSTSATTTTARQQQHHGIHSPCAGLEGGRLRGGILYKLES